MSNFPTPESFALLRERGVRYVVVRLNWYHHKRRPVVEQGLVHYVSQGVLRFLDRDVERNDKGDVIADVVLYQIIRYPDDRTLATNPIP
jgi:hypothetical protein